MIWQACSFRLSAQEEAKNSQFILKLNLKSACLPFFPFSPPCARPGYTPSTPSLRLWECFLSFKDWAFHSCSVFYLLSEGLNLGILHSSKFHPVLMEEHKNGNSGIESASPIQGKKICIDNTGGQFDPTVQAQNCCLMSLKSDDQCRIDSHPLIHFTAWWSSGEYSSRFNVGLRQSACLEQDGDHINHRTWCSGGSAQMTHFMPFIQMSVSDLLCRHTCEHTWSERCTQIWSDTNREKSQEGYFKAGWRFKEVSHKMVSVKQHSSSGSYLL